MVQRLALFRSGVLRNGQISAVQNGMAATNPALFRAWEI
jgi:hypothetical protein